MTSNNDYTALSGPPPPFYEVGLDVLPSAGTPSENENQAPGRPYFSTQSQDSRNTCTEKKPSSRVKEVLHALPVVNETANRWRDSKFFPIWWLELLSSFIIVAALIGIIITISNYNNKPLQDWPYKLSINTFIAAYSVIIKAAAGLILADGISHLKWTNLTKPRPLRNFVAYDDASRGPWGAVVLLWRERGRHIGSLGAVVTILILLLEPFSQQIVRFSSCVQVSEHQVASIPRTNAYWEMGSHEGAGLRTLPFPIRNAFHQGLFATTPPQVPVVCPTGNCTFSQEYSSVAYCSSCKNITKELVLTRYNLQVEDESEPAEAWLNVTIPPPYEDVEGTTLTLNMDGDRANPSFVSQTFGSKVQMIRRFKSDRIDRSRFLGKYTAYECEFWPCTKTFSAEVVNGELRERVVSSSDPGTYIFSGDQVAGPADLNCADSGARTVLRELGYNISEKQRWFAYGVSAVDSAGTFDYPHVSYNCEEHSKSVQEKYCHMDNGTYRLNDQASRLINASCMYSIFYETVMSIDRALLPQIFEGTLMESPSYNHEAFSGPATLLAVWNAGSGNGTLDDMTALMANISTSYTNHIRITGNENSSIPATGQVSFNTTCIRVRWEWVAYSIAMVVLTILFFVGVVIRARIDQGFLRGLWRDGDVPPYHDFKSSALTLLYHGFERESLEDEGVVGRGNCEGDLRRRAGEVSVRLVATEKGWMLSTRDG